MNWGGAVVIAIAVILIAMAYNGTYKQVGAIIGLPGTGRAALKP